jgi:hypothetical protein
MEEALVSHLLATAGLSALVGARINWGVRPQGQSLPALVLQVVSAPRDYTMTRRDPVTGYLVQIDVWAGAYATAKQVSRQVLVAMDDLTTPPFQGAFLDNERDTFEAGDAPQGSAPTDFHRVSMDYRVWANS